MKSTVDAKAFSAALDKVSLSLSRFVFVLRGTAVSAQQRT